MRNKPITLITLIGLVITACNNGGNTSTSPQASIPQLNQNAINFIFVQSFESNSKFNNLSVQGFNHSLLFGQLLNQITAAKITGIYALDPGSDVVNGYPNMAAIQSIENYAVLNGRGITDTLPNNADAIGSLIYNILSNSSTGATNGNYILALPAATINATLNGLSSVPNLYFNYQPLTDSNQYAILSIANMANVTMNTYNDGITPSNNYPQLKLTTGAQCLESSVIIHSTGTPPANINTNETVYFVRHVEAHPGNNFDNGNYVCQGQWRAIGANSILLGIMGSMPDYIYSSSPADIYWTPTFPYTYVRPSLTINPFTIQYNQPLNLVESSQFIWNNYESMAQYFFTGNTFSNKTMLIAWEHDTIDNMVKYLFTNIYNQALPANLPTWSSTDYDTVWKLQTDSRGNLTFSNTCEGIADQTLPLSCPLF
ncbi:MAG: hypothetical protein K2Q03_00930 [Sphingobacteriaceae bacterium]|nr:hypothetical protein [Sphingobacteriaceae bacterium]